MIIHAQGPSRERPKAAGRVGRWLPRPGAPQYHYCNVFFYGRGLNLPYLPVARHHIGLAAQDRRQGPGIIACGYWLTPPSGILR